MSSLSTMYSSYEKRTLAAIAQYNSEASEFAWVDGQERREKQQAYLHHLEMQARAMNAYADRLETEGLAMIMPAPGATKRFYDDVLDGSQIALNDPPTKRSKLE
ncbi:hypothetical protein MIND_00210700 [Mycena indigotica]|uniref:Uncharacterized protein n=1 Tax=Mycena indigotica TaxID=2126181 RepID=A0A8H6T730_9AGAR|nr:uncharacterized protein MIND_00210700 [Mycena indigotica]KAF7311989.1 hypothetical protein MIND_00210700 [Mycena indigotica]